MLGIAFNDCIQRGRNHIRKDDMIINIYIYIKEKENKGTTHENQENNLNQEVNRHPAFSETTIPKN